jgi:hypothetical protein
MASLMYLFCPSSPPHQYRYACYDNSKGLDDGLDNWIPRASNVVLHIYSTKVFASVRKVVCICRKLTLDFNISLDLGKHIPVSKDKGCRYDHVEYKSR